MTAITYPGTVYPLSEAQGQCDITSQGPSYNIANTAFFQKELHPKSLDAELWRNGTTPVITMFFNDRGTNNEALVEPEVHLTCLRTVPSEKQASENVARRLARASWLAIVAMSFAALVLS